MKGIIFNELERMVGESMGEHVWDEVLARTKLRTDTGVFVGPKSYPDEDLVALVDTISRLTNKPAAELITEYGRFLFPRLVERYPMFVQAGMNAKDFLISVDRIIHVEVRKLHPDAGVPEFQYEDPAADRLVLIYRSPRKLCDLVVGLLIGVGVSFREQITQTQTRCTKRGDESCRFELQFAPVV